MTRPDVRSIAALTRVEGDGQRLVGAAIEYDRPVADLQLAPETFGIDGRTVLAAYANDRPALTGEPARGPYVVLELDPSEEGARLWRPRRIDRKGPPRLGDTTVTGDVVPARVLVEQHRELLAADGSRIPPFGPRTSDRAIDPVVDRFEQHEFLDPVTSRTLRYNLFEPDGPAPAGGFPLVLFVHDGGVISADPKATLVQGLGAVAWATPEDQAEHPCYVLAPQLEEIVVDDDYRPSDLLDALLHLVDDVVARHAVDPARIVTTGGSMGAMLSLAMQLARPDRFAASVIVGGQWPAERLAPLADARMWVLVSEGDAKAFPEQNATMEVLEAAGARIVRARWDGRSPVHDLEHAVREVMSSGANVQYTTFLPGTVDPSGSTDPIAEHLNTWRVGYAIPGIRAWALAQRR